MEYPSTEFFPLMNGGENICFITALFGELKAKENINYIIDRKSYSMVYY